MDCAYSFERPESNAHLMETMKDPNHQDYRDRQLKQHTFRNILRVKADLAQWHLSQAEYKPAVEYTEQVCTTLYYAMHISSHIAHHYTLHKHETHRNVPIYPRELVLRWSVDFYQCQYSLIILIIILLYFCGIHIVVPLGLQ